MSLRWVGPSALDDGDEWYTDGAADGTLHAFVFNSKAGPVHWKVSNHSLNTNDVVLAEGNNDTLAEAMSEAEAFIANALKGSRMPTKYARYLVVIDREMGEDDGFDYHHGVGKAAVAQLSRELQNAWDETGVAGHYQVVSRSLVDDDAPALDQLVGRYEDDSNSLIESMADLMRGCAPEETT